MSGEDFACESIWESILRSAKGTKQRSGKAQMSETISFVLRLTTVAYFCATGSRGFKALFKYPTSSLIGSCCGCHAMTGTFD